MTPTPVPSPSDPVQWWDLFASIGPMAIILGALVAGLVGWRTIRQRTVADARSEWWKRTQWAIEMAREKDPDARTLGFSILTLLAKSKLAAREELLLLDEALRTLKNPTNGERAVVQPIEPEAVSGSEPEATPLKDQSAWKIFWQRLTGSAPGNEYVQTDLDSEDDNGNNGSNDENEELP
ncbi:hypothetical protein [Arthrobacter glacialis]|nr:hypothetical protein [Arthrobacter glacialis]